MNNLFSTIITGTRGKLDDLPVRYQKNLSSDRFNLFSTNTLSGLNRPEADVFGSTHYDLFFSTIGLDNPIH
jgi:hypothetical protein